MATTPRTSAGREHDDAVVYPTSDGRPMGETDLHRQRMVDLIEALEDRFAADPNAYVSGDLLVFYEQGQPRKHVAPDAFVVFGVPKRPLRDHYLVWQEGKGPDVVVEITSKTTRREDQRKKLALYRDALNVPESFQFDPTEDYLRPPLQGFRLVGGEYAPIEPVDGRLPSRVLGLHFERDGNEIRLFDPAARRRLPSRLERLEQAERAVVDLGRQGLEMVAKSMDLVSQVADVVAENDRLRREVEELKRRLSGGGEGA